MTCDELRTNMAGLAALPAADPERQAAEAHARGCEACRQELAEAQRMIALLERIPAPEPPSAAVLSRVRMQIFAQLKSRFLLRALPLAVAAVFALLVSVTHTHAEDNGWIGSVVVGAAAALFAITAALQGRVAIVVAAAGSTLFALTVARGSGAADATTGAHCMATELLAAALPLAVTFALVASKKAWPVQGGAPALFGAAAAVGALAGQGAIHLACPVRSQQHLLAFHTGGVVVAILVGLALSQLPVLKYSSAR
jgi:hypothetical protein